jgi:adsorption protein B
MAPFFAGLDLVMREAALFAATGFLLLGASDLAVDAIWAGLKLRARSALPLLVTDLPPPLRPGRLAIFLPAWDEAAVIGQMLRNSLATIAHANYVVYVGCYPNDPGGIAAVRAVDDPRVRLVVGPVPGPTTKADCLNRLWRQLRADELAEGWRAKAVILHDAEDVIDPCELDVFDALIDRFDMVQLPVIPLIDPNSRWIAGHYADEFAESHGKEMVVREAIGAALPSAGVGCAFAREALDEVAEANGGDPFDAASLTEDYELGLRLGGAGRRSAFVRLADSTGCAPVGTREYFPSNLDAAIAQKARWMTGIALSGWDRLGWSGGIAETWMRLRDRQSVLAALFLLAGYLAFLLWLLLGIRQIITGSVPTPVDPLLAGLLQINVVMLGWRLAVRFGFVARAYGWREGLRSIPRVVIGNVVALCAAHRALIRYRAIRRTGEARWDKTAHQFPLTGPAE